MKSRNISRSHVADILSWASHICQLEHNENYSFSTSHPTDFRIVPMRNVLRANCSVQPPLSTDEFVPTLSCFFPAKNIPREDLVLLSSSVRWSYNVHEEYVLLVYRSSVIFTYTLKKIIEPSSCNAAQSSVAVKNSAPRAIANQRRSSTAANRASWIYEDAADWSTLSPPLPVPASGESALLMRFRHPTFPVCPAHSSPHSPGDAARPHIKQLCGHAALIAS